MNKPINILTNHLINFTLHLADNTLIISHKNSEWCGHGPILEQDIALTNIALDLLGQARNFYQYTATLINQSSNQPIDIATEDSLAYLRDVLDYKNCLLAEQPNGDWATTILRQFFFSTYQYYLYQQLQNNNDEQIKAIAVKALKEVTYHLRWSSEWVIRLGDGTDESKKRLQNALDGLWNFTAELFEPVDYELHQNIDFILLKQQWTEKVSAIFKEATITIPAETKWHQSGGKNGIHSEHLGYMLAEMQFLQRAYPNAEW
jgi:ring-1,2-phenylacetyl-CoA epoxidase subunit PaaC